MQNEDKKTIITLFIPAVSLLVSGFFLICGGMYIGILGAGCGGLLPMLIIILFNVDTSQYFVEKMIIFILSVTFVAITFIDWLPEGNNMIIFIKVLLFIEVVYAICRGKDFKEKLCLFLSSPVFFYIGIVIDLLYSWDFSRSLNIPG